MEMKLINIDNEDMKDKDVIKNEIEILANLPTAQNKFPLFRQFIKFAGPGFLISIACLDPGNLSGDIAIAQQTRFRLFWVLILAHVMAYVYQSISLTLSMIHF